MPRNSRDGERERLDELFREFHRIVAEIQKLRPNHVFSVSARYYAEEEREDVKLAKRRRGGSPVGPVSRYVVSPPGGWFETPPPAVDTGLRDPRPARDSATTFPSFRPTST